jgi:hypothetical protein
MFSNGFPFSISSNCLLTAYFAAAAAAAAAYFAACLA